MQAATDLMDGRYADAQLSGARALELAADADPNAPAIHLATEVMRTVDCGEASETAAFMGAIRADLETVPTFMAGLAMASAFGGAPEVAREILAGHAAAGFADVRRDLEWLPVMGLLCHACIGLGAQEYAGALYEQLASHPARAVRVAPLGGFWGPTDYYLGALCRLLGRPDEAETRLRTAVQICVDLGALPWLARTQLQLADLLTARSPASDDEVASLRAAAIASATALGAHGILALARSSFRATP